MRIIFKLILLTFLFYGCSNNEAINQLEKEKKNIESKISELEKDKERLNEDLQFYKKSLADMRKKYDSILFEISPLGLTLGEYYGSDENQYIFGNGSLIHYSWGTDDYELGTWELKNGTIFINLTKGVYQKGIGEPLPPPTAVPGNYVDQYEEYEQVIEDINKVMDLNWSEIKSLLIEDSEYPYKRLGYDRTLNLRKYDLDSN